MTLNLKEYFPEKFLTKLSLQTKNKNQSISDSHMPLISVVMPSFNQVKYIEKSILSVLNQDYPNKELIIVDGGSKDGTLQLIKKYKNYIKYWVSEKDRGQSDALNKGFKVCKGEIYCWLNSDDVFLPGTFTTISKILMQNKKKKLCFGDWVSIDSNSNITDVHYAFDLNINHFKYEGFHLNAQSLFWLKEVHDNFSGFDLKLNKTMDYQMILEFALKQSATAFIRVDKILGGFRRYHGQKTGDYNLEEHKEHQYLSKLYKYEDKYSLNGKIKRFFYRFRRAFWYFKRGGVKELLKRLQKWQILSINQN